MHNAAFTALGLDYRYLAFRVRPADLRTAIGSIRVLGMRGVNITLPHKRRAIRHVDSLSDTAAVVGAVNTIVNDDGRLHGDNTDVFGFVSSLRSRRRSLRGKTAIVVGAGGAARAILVGLRQLEIGEVVVANRRLGSARSLLKALSTAAPNGRVVPLADLVAPGIFANVALVVNATSLGWGEAPFPPIAIDASARNCLFYDTAYGRATEFLRLARSAGRPTMDGVEMLVFQGARAFELWTGRRAPVTAMRTALLTQISN